MGDHEGWAQPSGLSPNGLLPNETASVTRVLDLERWAIAEERTADLIARIQPNKPSEERRNAVAEYVQRLIMKCFSCQVFTFGSVPLKTYLPDGDIDLTAFSKNQNLKDTWADEVRNILETEEKKENAEFRVKEVQYIQAEVKIIKCLVENIVVDISFNQLGGLCTLCFLEEVDHLINQNHLFKRSIILIKAWCYYESRILGAHHGLISTYALETLVLYIFHVFNNSFAGPLEVLYRFLEFFSNFDWDNFCVSLWGPVPICSLPDMTAEPPRKDSGELFLSKLFLDACSSVYAVFPGGQENQGQPFVSKYFNVIDPLRTNNNLGRSVSKGNFFRIRSAFAFGAKRLARLLDCPKDNLIAEINQFFMNTWDRHGSGNRPDAPSSDIRRFQLLNSGCMDESNHVKSNSSGKKMSDSSSSHEYEVEGICTDTCGLSSQHDNHPLENKSRTSKLSSGSRTQYQKNCGNTFVSRISDQIARNISSNENAGIDKGKKSSRLDHLVNDITSRYQFARTRSSPELTDTSSEVSSRGRRNTRPETVKSEISTVRAGHSNRRKNLGLGSENSGSQSARSSADDQSSLKQNSSFHSLDSDVDSKSVSNSYHGESVSGTVGEEFASVSEKMEMHQEEQDLVDMMASTRMHSFNGHIQIPMNLASSHLPLSISPSVLNSVGFGHRNLRGMVPTNIPLMEPMWGSNIQFPQTLVSSSLSHYFPGIGVDSNPEAIVEPGNGNLGSTETNQEDGDHGFWREQDIGSARELNSDNGTLQMLQSDDEQPSTSSGFNFLPSSRISSSANPSMRSQQRSMKGNREFIREHDDSFQCQNSRYNEVYSADRISSSRFLPASQHSSSRSRASSESSWDGSSARVSKSTRDKRGRKTTPDVCGKGQSGWQHESVSVDYVFSQADDVASSDVRNHEAPGYEPAHLGASDSVMPISPMLLDPGSQRRTADNPGVVPFAFYPTGPPVPFLTMLPVYNFPSDMDNSNTPTSHFDREHGLDNSHMNQSNQNLESVESIDQSETFSGYSYTKGDTCLDPSEEYKDILTSDFASHWQNLQFGRFCQSPRYHGPLIYPSSVVVPPVYLQGHFPWDGPGRPLSANGNLFSQLMSYGPHLVPVAPIQSGSNRPADLYQRYGNEFPRYRGGTGTYLPNPKVSARDRQSSSTRNQRGNYNYNRNDHHGDREGNWNGNSKPRAAGRSHGRNQAEKPSSRLDRLAASDSRSDRPWELYRHGSHPSYHTQNGPFISSNSVHSGSTNMAYGMFPLPAVNSNGVSPTGPAVPSVVMLYSYDNNAGYGSTAEHLEFGSVGPVHFSGMNEVSQHGEGGQARGMYEQRRFLGSSTCSSPDQPSSPQFQRGI